MNKWQLERKIRDVSRQMVFWMFADIMLILLMSIILEIPKSTNQLEDIPPLFNLSNIILAIVFGSLQGLIFGISNYIITFKGLDKMPIGFIIMTKAILYIITSFLLISLIKWTYEHDVIILLNRQVYNLSNHTWRIVFNLILVYNFIMGLFIGFINQVRKKFGSNMLRKLLVGQYIKPKEENRVFLFLDLKSSTTIAEKLGHIKYSAFIRDFILDINRVVARHKAQIYQYAGDEVILTWYTRQAIHKNECLVFFFECEKEIASRSSYYDKQYGIIPVFKAGAHAGMVTAVEIGDQKKDIAFHGDVLNTAARLQGICNTFNKNLLISNQLANLLTPHNYDFESLGDTSLKGKNDKTEVISVTCNVA